MSTQALQIAVRELIVADLSKIGEPGVFTVDHTILSENVLSGAENAAVLKANRRTIAALAKNFPNQTSTWITYIDGNHKRVFRFTWHYLN